VLGELAFLHLDLAAAAGGTTAAHAFHIDAELARGVEDRRALGEPPALAGRHEKHQRIREVWRRVHEHRSVFKARLGITGSHRMPCLP
jgi:hypothetical protein